jgi:Ribonuclease G/E
MYCRKKNRRRWRHRVAENRRAAKPRGQTIQTPTVKELLVRDRGGYTFIDVIGYTNKRIRAIRRRTRQTLERI